MTNKQIHNVTHGLPIRIITCTCGKKWDAGKDWSNYKKAIDHAKKYQTK